MGGGVKVGRKKDVFVSTPSSEGIHRFFCFGEDADGVAGSRLSCPMPRLLGSSDTDKYRTGC